jgi:hypothetical protein
MGQYESTSRNSPFNPRGLVENADILRGLLKIEPTSEIHTQSLKAALLKLLTDDPGLNKTKFQGSVWITLRMERITTILNHVRKLANDTEGFRICASRLSGSDYQILRGIVEMVETKDLGKGVPNLKGTEAKNAEEEKEKNWDAATVDYGKPPCERDLKKNLSEVSVDEDGFPKMLNSPAKDGGGSQSSRLGTKVSEESWQDENQKKLLRCSLGFNKSENTSTSSSSRKRHLGKGDPEPVEGDSGIGKGDPVIGEGPWLKLSKTNASKPERAYILGCHSKDEKMKLVVEVAKTWSSQYSFVIDQILKALREENLTKEQAKELRAKLCEQYP